MQGKAGGRKCRTATHAHLSSGDGGTSSTWLPQRRGQENSSTGRRNRIGRVMPGDWSGQRARVAVAMPGPQRPPTTFLRLCQRTRTRCHQRLLRRPWGQQPDWQQVVPRAVVLSAALPSAARCGGHAAGRTNGRGARYKRRSGAQDCAAEKKHRSSDTSIATWARRLPALRCSTNNKHPAQRMRLGGLGAWLRPLSGPAVRTAPTLERWASLQCSAALHTCETSSSNPAWLLAGMLHDVLLLLARWPLELPAMIMATRW